MTAGYWHKGRAKPPDHAQPGRHTRQKIALLMPYLDGGDREAVLLKIAEKRPEIVLEAMCDVTDDDAVTGKRDPLACPCCVFGEDDCWCRADCGAQRCQAADDVPESEGK